MRWLPLIALMACGPKDPAPTTPTDTGTVGTTQVGALQFRGQPPKNLLMISIDTLRKDHVGRYGGGELTPFLDGLLAESVALDDFVQCSNWTFSSVPCTLGGRPHAEVGFMPRLDRDLRQPYPEGTPFLAGHLETAGYDSWLFSINSWLSKSWGTSQGYDHEVWPGIFHTDEIVRRAADQLIEGTADHDDPWFLHVHVKEPHAPYHAPFDYNDELAALEPVSWDLDDFLVHYEVTEDVWPTLTPEEQQLLEAHLRARYRAEVRWLDQQLAQRWADLEARGLLDDTLVVMWSDHGEQFWEHGAQTHAYGLHGEEVDALAFFWAKNLEPVAFEGPTHGTDITPTVLATLGVTPTVPLTGHVVGEAPNDRIRLVSTVARIGAHTAAERDGIKVIFDWAGTVTAFDTRVDPGETNDIWNPADPEQAALFEAIRVRAEAESALMPDQTPVWPE